MMLFVLLILLAAGLPAQWITGQYAAQNGVLPVSNIPWSKYTHVVHFAAAPNIDGTVNPYLINQAEIDSIISSRPAGKKVNVSIKDNDTNYNPFDFATAPAYIGTFVTNIANFVNANQYDGVDIGWEANVNVTQYRDLLKHLRKAIPGKIITIDSGNWNNLETVAATSHPLLDQINLMCYDMDGPGNGYSWHNNALLQNGNSSVMTCDWRVRAFTSAGVPTAKIGIGIPFYGRRWSGVTLPLVSGNFSITPVAYRDLVRDTTRWQPQYQIYDSGHLANYLSIPGLSEFISYNGTQFIRDAVAWQKAQGFGGFMTFTLDYEYLAEQIEDARYPLSTALFSNVLNVWAPY